MSLPTWLMMPAMRVLLKKLNATAPEERKQLIMKVRESAPADVRRLLNAALGPDEDKAERPASEGIQSGAGGQSRVPGTRWIPPAQVRGPVLAVHLEGPDRVVADYKEEGGRKQPALGTRSSEPEAAKLAE